MPAKGRSRKTNSHKPANVKAEAECVPQAKRKWKLVGSAGLSPESIIDDMSDACKMEYVQELLSSPYEDMGLSELKGGLARHVRGWHVRMKELAAQPAWSVGDAADVLVAGPGFFLRDFADTELRQTKFRARFVQLSDGTKTLTQPVIEKAKTHIVETLNAGLAAGELTPLNDGGGTVWLRAGDVVRWARARGFELPKAIAAMPELPVTPEAAALVKRDGKKGAGRSERFSRDLAKSVFEAWNKFRASHPRARYNDFLKCAPEDLKARMRTEPANILFARDVESCLQTHRARGRRR